jgi:methylglyoxal synthase
MATMRTTVDGYLISILLDSSRSLSATSAIRLQASGRPNGTTGSILSAELSLDITTFASEPFGGDQQVGAAIVEERIDFVVFFSDPLEPHPHDMDVKSLQRMRWFTTFPWHATGRRRIHHLLTADEGRVPPPYHGNRRSGCTMGSNRNGG